MTRHQMELSRLKSAYALNHIPVPPSTERLLRKLPVTRLASLADHWEMRAAQAHRADKPGDDEPPLFGPRQTVYGLTKILRRMSAFRGPPHKDYGLDAEVRYNGGLTKN